MANTCITTYVIQGQKENIARLKKDLMSIRDPESPTDSEPWAGCFLQFLGINPEGQDCRGGIPNTDGALEISEDDTQLKFTTESKWTRMRCLEQILPEHYDVTVWYLEEELGNDVFDTNDEEHTVFPAYVIIDGDTLERDDYYYTPEDARQYLGEILEKNGNKPDNFDKMTLEEIAEYVYGEYDNLWVHIAEIS